MHDWREDGICNQLDEVTADKMFFIGPGGSPKRAALFCAQCPVLAQCRDYAILYSEEGIWGGMTSDERRGLAWLQPILRERALQARQLEVRYDPNAQFEVSCDPTEYQSSEAI